MTIYRAERGPVYGISSKESEEKNGAKSVYVLVESRMKYSVSVVKSPDDIENERRCRLKDYSRRGICGFLSFPRVIVL